MRPLDFMMLVGGLAASAGFCSAAEPAQSNVGPCVDVQVGNEHVSDLDCINQKLRKLSVQSQSQSGAQSDAPIGAASSTTQTGTANQAAAQQMMGNAFGKSAQPQRPHPTYVTPLPGVPAAR
jgi:hypothetical protein